MCGQGEGVIIGSLVSLNSLMWWIKSKLVHDDEDDEVEMDVEPPTKVTSFKEAILILEDIS